MLLFLAFWTVFGLGYGLALAANAHHTVFKDWVSQLTVVLVCMLLGPVVAVFQFIYRYFKD